MSTAPPETAEIVLRSARPEDGLQTADLIVSTGETIFRYLFYQERERTVDLVRRLFGLENNEFSHRHIHLAEIGGEIAGLVCFFTREEMAANERTMAWAIIRHLDLRKPIYQPTACYGHFGRTDIDATWERTDKAALLRREAGL